MRHEGRPVVDAVAGVADQRTGEPVGSHTLFFAASAAKGVASTVAHVLAERGEPAYDHAPGLDLRDGRLQRLRRVRRHRLRDRGCRHAQPHRRRLLRGDGGR
ncbi:MAG: serine hydrolase [Solirubrobacteraceae bacterium]